MTELAKLIDLEVNFHGWLREYGYDMRAGRRYYFAGHYERGERYAWHFTDAHIDVIAR